MTNVLINSLIAYRNKPKNIKQMLIKHLMSKYLSIQEDKNSQYDMYVTLSVLKYLNYRENDMVINNLCVNLYSQQLNEFVEGLYIYTQFNHIYNRDNLCLSIAINEMLKLGSAVVDFTQTDTKCDLIMKQIFRSYTKNGIRLAGFIPGSGIYELQKSNGEMFTNRIQQQQQQFSINNLYNLKERTISKLSRLAQLSQHDLNTDTFNVILSQAAMKSNNFRLPQNINAMYFYGLNYVQPPPIHFQRPELIQSLTIEQCTYFSIKQCVHIQQLGMYNICDVILDDLFGLQQLRSLHVVNTKLSQKNSCVQFGNSILEYINNWSCLNHLTLKYIQFTSVLNVKIAKQSNLQALVIYSSLVSQLNIMFANDYLSIAKDELILIQTNAQVQIYNDPNIVFVHQIIS